LKAFKEVLLNQQAKDATEANVECTKENNVRKLAPFVDH